MNHFTIPLLLAGLLAVLPACAGQTAPQPKSAPVSSTAASEAVVETSGSLTEVLEELPAKTIPGCRNTLANPLKMSSGSTAKDFSQWSATDIDGNAVNQDILKGSKLTLVSAWSSYCGSCVPDLQAMQALYDAYPREQLNVLGIVASAQDPDGSISENELTIVRQIQEITGAAFPQLLPSDDLIAIHLKDLDIVPESFLLDSQGRMVGEPFTGGRTEEQFRQIVEEALKSLAEGEK